MDSAGVVSRGSVGLAQDKSIEKTGPLRRNINVLGSCVVAHSTVRLTGAHARVTRVAAVPVRGVVGAIDRGIVGDCAMVVLDRMSCTD